MILGMALLSIIFLKLTLDKNTETREYVISFLMYLHWEWEIYLFVYHAVLILYEGLYWFRRGF